MAAADEQNDIPALRRDEWRRPERRAEAGRSRAEDAADVIAGLSLGVKQGTRLGTKEELRARCGVSVGTFNEAVRLVQARGLVTVRPGPGGGLFAAEQSPMVRLGHSVLALDSDKSSVSDAVRIRDALDPLLIEDALWHASPADIAALRELLKPMASAVADADPTAFVHANWQFHVRIAAISQNRMLRSIYSTLLDIIEGHTLSVLPTEDRPLPEYIQQRYQLHSSLVDALERRDACEASRLIRAHNTSSVES
ncbi:FadR/GntR family transcriptional regulator [Actinocorallia sp. A-T 12471]|uniref:FadR/GntR family transcriptional regulator n=1 Tax=Actinocorallia sp. A-T 12471 TaxID=3089813 RepID=UPI0029D0A2D6|nr:FCD domain-containing protein [Actinocorallia sp. A-T 12471]MDX6741566.1 FCD domain-containing protein [Actinocorallia sp. A-T 12471]